jgi:hypothetical protein
MNKFDSIINKYSDIITEMEATPPQLDLTKLDQMKGEDLQAGLMAIYNDEAQVQQIMQQLVSQSDPNAQQADPNADPNAQQADPNAQQADPNAQQVDQTDQNTQQTTTNTNVQQPTIKKPNPLAGPEKQGLYGRQ